MTRRDRAAMRLALEVLRAEYGSAGLAADVLERGDDAAEALGEAVEGQRNLDHHYRCCGGGPVSSAESARRLLRARLALVLRAMLRADKGDYGEIACTGCGDSDSYHRPGDGCRDCWIEHWQLTGQIISDNERPRYERVRIAPLWERAPAHDGRTPQQRREAGT
jgi:hypothetical protein